MHNYYNHTTTLSLPIYGLHIQDLLNHLLTIKDRKKRTQYAFELVNFIQRVHYPGKHKLISTPKIWDDLWVISNYKLNVDAPYPTPPKKSLKKPEKITYNTYKPSAYAQYYGYNITDYLTKLAQLPHTMSLIQEKLLTHTVRLMYKLHKKNKSLDTILEDVQTILKHKLTKQLQSIKHTLKSQS